MGNFSVEYLKSILRYDPETGLFIRLVSISNTHIGDIAGSSDGTKNKGYIRISVKGKIYKAHRLAWLYMTGNWPKNQIDHINGVKSDNRWSNLRDVSQTNNRYNVSKANSQNSCGYLGVSKVGNSYIARLRAAPKTLYIGSFPTPEEAHKAYLEFKQKYINGMV